MTQLYAFCDDKGVRGILKRHVSLLKSSLENFVGAFNGYLISLINQLFISTIHTQRTLLRCLNKWHREKKNRIERR
jgi:hypothetical protein